MTNNNVDGSRQLFLLAESRPLHRTEIFELMAFSVTPFPILFVHRFYGIFPLPPYI